MDGDSKRQTQRDELHTAGQEVSHGPKDSKKVAESPQRPEYTLSERKNLFFQGYVSEFVYSPKWM